MKPFLIAVAVLVAVPNGFFAALIAKAIWEQHRAQRPHCAVCADLGPINQPHPYLLWLETHVAWEDA